MGQSQAFDYRPTTLRGWVHRRMAEVLLEIDMKLVATNNTAAITGIYMSAIGYFLAH